MKERPILFSRPMVRAILEGRKTMTRRVIKPQPESDFWLGTHLGDVFLRCPFGQIRSQLWVRETIRMRWIDMQKHMAGASYEADLTPVMGFGPEGSYNGRTIGWPWKRTIIPSIFMPRWASRLTLEITGMRVERLQDIGEADARAEGAEFRKGEWGELDAFNNIWDSINAKRGYTWDSNPFVWVLTFEKIKP